MTALLGRRSVRSRSHPWARRPSCWNDPRAWVQDRATFTDRRRLRSSDDLRAAARSSSPGGSSPRRKDTILDSVSSFIVFLRFIVEILTLYNSLIQTFTPSRWSREDCDLRDIRDWQIFFIFFSVLCRSLRWRRRYRSIFCDIFLIS